MITTQPPNYWHHPGVTNGNRENNIWSADWSQFGSSNPDPHEEAGGSASADLQNRRKATKGAEIDQLFRNCRLVCEGRWQN
jgi:hypothetical protein